MLRTICAFLLVIWAVPAAATQLPERVGNALLHVIAHEAGHAVLRELDLPILGPEEGIAEDFATACIYLTLPERAEAIIEARSVALGRWGEARTIFGIPPRHITGGTDDLPPLWF